MLGSLKSDGTGFKLSSLFDCDFIFSYVLHALPEKVWLQPATSKTNRMANSEQHVGSRNNAAPDTCGVKTQVWGRGVAQARCHKDHGYSVL
ncbi:hypothetical protein CK203_009497 [Vitis vinifera]|uniref:Uncharacterized protein n=1 Tax=Vitis vinifera TaxID=29760 RepID=A0A438JSD2_VITVI|nr:hypothetical protein CK203_009497 [Vitis vinifera]